jgi:ectoine hydroxylase-related dioxygenase (phytanoyl-CoA dioxygenase family)
MVEPLAIEAPSVDAICRRIDDHGYCVVPDVLGPDELAYVRAALDRAAAEDDAAGVAVRYGPDGVNQRLWALLNRGDEFIGLATHPLVLPVMRKTLGYHEILLSSLAANITNPGGDHEIGHLHYDQGYLPVEYRSKVVAATVAFFLDDFTAENGATVFVPKSHKMGPPLDHSFGPKAPAQITGPAGSMAIWDGRLHHATGLNRTADKQRRAVLATYVAPFIRGQENWCRSLDRRLFDKHPELALLTGFEEWLTLGADNGTKTTNLNF